MPFDQDAAPFSSCRAVLFDLDGTLIETHLDFSGMAQAMRDLAQGAGIPASLLYGKDILGMVGAGARHLQGRGEDGDAFRRMAFAHLEEWEAVGCAQPVLLPGAQALLSDLRRQGRRVGIVTRNCRRVSQGLADRFQLSYDALLSRDDVTLAKPHPEHLWEALQALGCRPDEAVMAGDHWMDIQAGQAAGCAATLGVLGDRESDWFAPCPPTRIARDLCAARPLFRADGA
jgi:phosphoglycolate phosphatase